MEAKIKEYLKTTKLSSTGRGGGGCINEGECFQTDNGEVFIKRNPKDMARLMFEGEMASLNAILSTNTVRAPKPFLVVDNPAGGAALVMESVKMRHLSKFSADLGEKLAYLHQYNEKMRKKAESGSIHNTKSDYVDEFGFHTTTCCGFIPLVNDWNSDWVLFFSKQRLAHQVKLAQEKYGDREVGELWGHLERKIPSLFEGCQITPSIVHGDLWGGNIAETETESIIFDPALFYGHSEFELAIAKMFGGFDAKFYSAYFKLMPKEPGFDKRIELYQLFHYLNHWNHFGGGYRSSSLSTMRRLIK